MSGLSFASIPYLIQKMTEYENINDKSNQTKYDMAVLIYFTQRLGMQKTKSSVLTFLKPEMAISLGLNLNKIVGYADPGGTFYQKIKLR